MKDVNTYTSIFCFQCNNQITLSQQFCTNCGTRNRHRENIQYQSSKPIDNISIGNVIVLMILLGIFSAIGYILWVRNPDSIPKRIMAVLLILLSIIVNIFVLSWLFS